MSEFYIEQLVKVKNKPNICGMLLLGVGAVLICASFVIQPGMIFILAGIAAAIAGSTMVSCGNIEYEYLFLNRDLEIDKIVAKKKRKHVYTLNMNDVVVVAKQDAGEVKVYQNIKYRDFSSGCNSNTVYKMVLSHEGKMEGILIEPTKELLKSMSLVAPRKVIMS